MLFWPAKGTKMQDWETHNYLAIIISCWRLRLWLIIFTFQPYYCGTYATVLHAID